ncbi:dihydrolipoyl dehydrogenase [Bifidobacterium eulemuris]|uniref:Dihydrolipoyl dehydrogenase n=1 Tax=Bifidobacterium eulemuris TaxID=1765219 RepID=A0A261GBT2_9BIFI|nr:dihydrolipoyl dehydrogenase [Bifidobacterium eulemuris]OZG68889.1 dihydrolipoamide dehydrogenase [Bifidobacterium eulemuris]QOL31572.1 dihydrolipoyl dehydrogenase [Bifidobacterium eulemuris]
MTQQYDVAIVGAGPGGYSTALRAAELGMSVALIEREGTVGGTCLNRGCIPSKALITAMHAMDAARHADVFGVRASVSGIDYNRLREYRLGAVATMTKGLSELLAQRKIDVLYGEAELADTHTIRILITDPADDGTQHVTTVTAEHIVLATGGRPRTLPGEPFRDALIDSTRALELDEFPSRAVIVGAGAIAVEFASLWNAAGCEVTLIIRKGRVLSGWDKRTGMTLTRELKRRGVTVIANASVTGVDTGIKTGATVRYTQAGGEETDVEADVVLAAIGRDPNTDAPWFDALGIARDTHGLLAVDELGRTSVPGVWAVGDITPGHALAHRAFAQGITVAEAIAGLEPRPVDEATVPGIVFSSPEAATVGLTEEQAKERDDLLNVKQTAYPMLGNARMMMSGTGGSMAVVSGERADRPGVPVVLGVHIVAPGASDLIAEAQQLVGARTPLAEAARLIHPHPTFSETLGEALLKADGRPLHTR